ncbi:alpha/beta fold hydrolase [Novosphingobium piscinae]|uniref:Alpha/beta fold hydrolase n=1 Tax=Novosphingobium piscinae TaxID=1507448 RepID=A0A7X1G0R3_9SPHN|nr:alpha/beta fold hydrolase [Novosphingobium piscinae]MBC2669877.1 alpha/beta fold hydrolase [Novosphingobium piscinae]
MVTSLPEPPILRAYTRCRWGQLHYRAAGPLGSPRPPVILLHQNPSSGFEYEPLIAALAGERRVIAFDTPGYGMSDPPPAPPGMAGYAAAFSEGLDALARDGLLAGPVDLYGFHTGTLLGAELAILRPDLVRRVAMTGIPLFPADEAAARLRSALDHPAPDEAGTVILALLERLYRYVVGERDPAVPLEKALLNFADKARVLHRFTWAYQGVWAWDFARLALVTQPVLVLQSHEDLLEASREASRSLRHLTWQELPGLDRDIFDVAPGRIAAALSAYFDAA